MKTRICLRDKAMARLEVREPFPQSNVDLSGNPLEDLRDITRAFPNVRILNLSRCGLRTMDGIDGTLASQICALDVSRNRLSNLAQLPRLSAIKRLDISSNPWQPRQEEFFPLGVSGLSELVYRDTYLNWLKLLRKMLENEFFLVGFEDFHRSPFQIGAQYCLDGCAPGRFVLQIRNALGVPADVHVFAASPQRIVRLQSAALAQEETSLVALLEDAATAEQTYLVAAVKMQSVFTLKAFAARDLSEINLHNETAVIQHQIDLQLLPLVKSGFVAPPALEYVMKVGEALRPIKITPNPVSPPRYYQSALTCTQVLQDIQVLLEKACGVQASREQARIMLQQSTSKQLPRERLVGQASRQILLKLSSAFLYALDVDEVECADGNIFTPMFPDHLLFAEIRDAIVPGDGPSAFPPGDFITAKLVERDAKYLLLFYDNVYRDAEERLLEYSFFVNGRTLQAGPSPWLDKERVQGQFGLLFAHATFPSSRVFVESAPLYLEKTKTGKIELNVRQALGEPLSQRSKQPKKAPAPAQTQPAISDQQALNQELGLQQQQAQQRANENPRFKMPSPKRGKESNTHIESSPPDFSLDRRAPLLQTQQQPVLSPRLIQGQMLIQQQLHQQQIMEQQQQIRLLSQEATRARLAAHEDSLEALKLQAFSLLHGPAQQRITTLVGPRLESPVPEVVYVPQTIVQTQGNGAPERKRSYEFPKNPSRKPDPRQIYTQRPRAQEPEALKLPGPGASPDPRHPSMTVDAPDLVVPYKATSKVPWDSPVAKKADKKPKGHKLDLQDAGSHTRDKLTSAQKSRLLYREGRKKSFQEAQSDDPLASARR